MKKHFLLPMLLAGALLAGCAQQPESADLLIVNGRVYTLSWDEPASDGTPALNAPYSQAEGWMPDAQALAIRSGKIVFVGDSGQAERYRGQGTQVIDVPIPVHVMLSARDTALLERWRQSGPDTEGPLTIRSVKAFCDGALGSRGARLLEDYSDRPGHRGVSGDEYGFDQEAVAAIMKAGFQVAIHAIGDAGNRSALDFLQAVQQADPASQALRHRIEHAQVLHPDDVARFAQLKVIASMEPPHAVEDKTWAEERLGPERVRYAYAWRTLRQAGARLVFNSDLPGSDYSIFYGLHAAITRRDKELAPEGGWYPKESMTPEEAIRGYTSWAAFSAFEEGETGSLQAGKRGDITVLDIDPMALGQSEPGKILQGKVLLTVAGGKIVFQAAQ